MTKKQDAACKAFIDRCEKSGLNSNDVLLSLTDKWVARENAMEASMAAKNGLKV